MFSNTAEKFDGIAKLTSWPKIGEITRKDCGACAYAVAASRSDAARIVAVAGARTDWLQSHEVKKRAGKDASIASLLGRGGARRFWARARDKM
ncbi:hypothetical protein [Bradyrhizobium sp. LB13.1]